MMQGNAVLGQFVQGRVHEVLITVLRTHPSKAIQSSGCYLLLFFVKGRDPPAIVVKQTLIAKGAIPSIVNAMQMFPLVLTMAAGRLTATAALSRRAHYNTQ